MASRAARAGLVAVAWTASALLVGYLLAPRFAPAPAEGLGTAEPASLPADARSDRAGLVPLAGDDLASVSATADPPRADASAGQGPEPIPRRSAGPEAPPPDPDAPISGLRVSVLHADGSPASGATVYALPAGAPGADDSDGLYAADCDDDGRVELGLPVGALVDVGAVGEGSHAMQRDVAVETGGGGEVRLSLGRGRPIALTIEFGTPISPQWQNRLQVIVRDEGSGTGVHRSFPGRDEHLSLGAHMIRFDAEGRGTTAPLVEGNRYRVDARNLQHAAAQVSGSPTAEYWADPPVAVAGGTVALRVRRQAELALRVSVAPALQAGQFGCTVWLVDGAGNRFASIVNASGDRIVGVPRPQAPLVIPAGVTPEQEAAARQVSEQQRAAWQPIAWPMVVPVPGAAAGLAWQGSGIRAGESGLLPFASGQRLEFAIRLEAADAVDVDGDGTRVGTGERRLLLSGPRPPVDDGASCYVYVLRGDDAHAEAEMLEFTPDEPTVRPEADDRALRSPAIAVAGGLLASLPFEFPAAGDILVELRPAGLLLVVDTGAIANPAGPILELERVDGAPIPWTEELGNLDFDGYNRAISASWTAWEAYRRVHCRLGAVLGPFPAGPVEFTMRRGGFPAGRVSARVVAGQIRPLVVG